MRTGQRTGFYIEQSNPDLEYLPYTPEEKRKSAKAIKSLCSVAEDRVYWHTTYQDQTPEPCKRLYYTVNSGLWSLDNACVVSG